MTQETRQGRFVDYQRLARLVFRRPMHMTQPTPTCCCSRRTTQNPCFQRNLSCALRATTGWGWLSHVHRPPENKTRKSLIINETSLPCFLGHCPPPGGVGVLTM